MSNASPDDPSNTAFDLFDRWMTNREVPKPEETAPAPAADFVIPDTKASREAARARLAEAARLEAEGLIDMEAVHAEPDAPVIPPVVAPEPITLVEPVALVAEPIAPVVPAVEPAAPVIETVALPEPIALPEAIALPEPIAPIVLTPEPVVAAEPAPLPAFELPAYRPPFAEHPVEPEPVVEPSVSLPVEAIAPVVELPVVELPVVETPVIETPVVETPAAPVGGKRRAAVATDSPPVLAPVVEGRRRRAVPVDEVAVEAPVALSPVADAPPVVEPVHIEPVAETPATEPAEAPRGSSWAEALAKLVEQEPKPEPEPAPNYFAALAEESPVAVSLEPEHSDGWDPLTAPLRPEDLEAEEPREGMNLRLIVSVLMVVAILGVGAAGYFLFRGEHWALKPTAALAALSTFLTTARFTF